MIERSKTIFQTIVYSKHEVQLLYKAYGLSFKQTDLKAVLSDKLTTKIKAFKQTLSPKILMNSTQQQPGTSPLNNTAQISSEIPGQEQSTCYVLSYYRKTN